MNTIARFVFCITRFWLLLLACAATLPAQAQTQIWSQTVSAGTPTPTGRGRSVLKMSNGDYVASYSVISGTAADVRVVRTDSAGTILWTRDLDKGRSDDVNDMVADSAGNIYVSMRPGIVGPTLTHLDWSVTKLLGTTGVEQWTYTFVGATLDGNDEVFGLAVAADGNIFAVGNAEGGVRARAAKINATTGTQMWAFMEADNTTIRFFSIAACDSLGNCYALGGYPNASFNNGIYLVKFDSAGNKLFDIKWWGPANLFASGTDIAFDSANQPIVTGNYRPSGSTQDMLLIKFNASTGAETWKSIIAGSATTATDTLSTLKLDASDNIYVAGFLRDTISATTDRIAYAARHSNADGSRAWFHTKNGTGALGTNSPDRYFTLLLSGSSVYLGGTITNTTTDLLSTKLDAATGTEQWSFGYDPSGAVDTNGFSTRKSIAISGTDSVVFVGEKGASPDGLLANVSTGSVGPAAPTVTTATQSAVTHNSATLGGDVTADGGASVTERGIVWSTSANPTTADTKVPNGSGTGAFSGTVTGLPSNTMIFVRAYAINSAGTGYGNEISFTTLVSAPTVTGVTSSTANGAYAASTVIPIQVSFSANVNVTGTPTLALNSGGTASYASGTGSSTLSFNYTVGAGQNSTDLDYTSTSALALSGGSIVSSVGAVAANLTLPAPGAAGSLGANKALVIDTTAPAVLSVVRLTPSGQTTSLTSVTFRVTYSEPVTLTVPVTTHFQVMPVNGSTITGTVQSVSGSGSTRDVQVNITGGSGEFRLRVID